MLTRHDTTVSTAILDQGSEGRRISHDAWFRRIWMEFSLSGQCVNRQP